MSYSKECCEVEIHPTAFDLGAQMWYELVEYDTPHPPVTIIHSNQAFGVRVKVKLTGTILHWLCGTLGVQVAFESCGSGAEGEYIDEKALVPCGDGLYEFLVLIPANTLKAGKFGKSYELCITLGSIDACGHAGLAFGHCHDFSVMIAPPVDHTKPVTP